MADWSTVVVGYDGSDDARRAVAAAADMAGSSGTVHVVTAYKPPSAGETAHLWHTLPEEFRTGFDPLHLPHTLLGEAKSLLRDHDAQVETHAVDDQPADAILEIAEKLGADLVVVGSRGLGRGARFLRGSVSTRVANNAKTNVLVVHHD